jgi:hypothetical protein
MKLLIKFPTRERPLKFFKILDLYYDYLSDINNVEFCISIDHDDLTMNNDDIKTKLESYPNLKYFIGESKSKIEAVNADIDRINNWDIILLASDDMIPKIKGYDKIIINKMKQYYPDTDGVVWFFDGNRKDLNTLCILGKKYYERFNYIYHPDYQSFYCDNEFTVVANKLNKQTFINKVIIKHEHPDMPEYKANLDNLYIKNSKYYNYDYNIFKIREQKNFEL